MKTPIKSHRRTRVVRTLSAFVFLLICSIHPEAFSGTPSVNETKEISSTTEKKKIKIALLLDTSNSMDGLIEQAKSQLWKFVNALSGATFQGEKPILEIALYEYGNDGLPSSEGYIRQVSIFTSDLDLISEKLLKENEQLTIKNMTRIMRQKEENIPKQPSSLDLLESMVNLTKDLDQKKLMLNLVGKLRKNNNALL